MAPKKRKISSLIESQLPGFINDEYENFSKFIAKYYEQQESAGQPIDLISNLSTYTDIDYYEKNLLKQSTTLVNTITADAAEVVLQDGSSFPEENGYIKIGEEILFYQKRTGNTLTDVSRGVSGNTTLGDLYHSSRFVTTSAASHGMGSEVYNISNLFLYALVKEFEKTYLGSFPESYLKQDVDKRLLIKNISNFYKAKGTDRSVKFLFNSIVSKSETDVPEIVNPKDYTLKASTSDWTQDYTIKCKVVSGNIANLVGNVITQDDGVNFSSAVVDNYRAIGSDGVDKIYELIIEPTTVNGNFRLSSRTSLTSNLSSAEQGTLKVRSTDGFPEVGSILVNDEVITYSSKTVNQFYIDQRGNNPRSHGKDQKVYSYNVATGSGVTLVLYGAVYGMGAQNPQPYSSAGDIVAVDKAGFVTLDPVVYDSTLDRTRWFINDDPAANPVTINSVSKPDIVGDVANIYEDDQYYYIASSGFPSGSSLVNTTYDLTGLDNQKNLKLIRKVPSATTEVYKTGTRDVGIFIDGVPALSYKDDKTEKFGPIVSTTITNRGTQYEAPPFVLVNEAINKARARLSGSVVDSIEILTNEVFSEDPTIRITSGEGAVLTPVITNGAITSLTVVEPGRFYSSPPIIRIVDNLGKGAFAEFEAVLDSNGGVEGATRISGGRFYTRGNTVVSVQAVGTSASATAKVREWTYDRYRSNVDFVDSDNGMTFESFEGNRGLGYGYVAAPKSVRTRAYANASDYGYNVQSSTSHSPIVGYAYDGNPIYGPYGYSDPYDSNSTISRIDSGYQIKSSRVGGPDVGLYPMGTFIDDYEWIPSVNSGKTELDQNNGRFCVTPDYPNGVYAYFLTVSEDTVTDCTPAFPYIVGENFYSLPVDSNYNSRISQDDIPVGVKSVRSSLSEINGVEFSGIISDVKRGNVDAVTVETSRPYFSPGSRVFINEDNTEGAGCIVNVGAVQGETVSSVESTETKAVQVRILENAYLFAGDEVGIYDTQQANELVGQGILIGDVIDDTNLVLRDVSNNFFSGDRYFIDSETLVQNLILDRDSSFSVGETLILTNDDDEIISSGEILETTARQNSVKVKVTLSNNPLLVAFAPTTEYYLRSSNLSDTNRSQVISTDSLSTGLTPFSVSTNIAIVQTTESHNLGLEDTVDVSILPNDNESTTTYYVRKRLYQTGTTFTPTHNSKLTDAGIGSADVLNSGDAYLSATYEDVELIFQDQNLIRTNLGYAGAPYNARATVNVSSPGGFLTGGVAEVIITTKGYGYRKGDILTIPDDVLNRDPNAANDQRFVLQVDHVGFAKENTILYVSNVSNVSQEDILQIGEEQVQVSSVDTTNRTITVTRGANGTTIANHFLNAEITLVNGVYRFDTNFMPFGDGLVKPTLLRYDQDTGEVFVAYDYSVSSPQKLSNSTSFFDSSIPAKQVRFLSVNEPVYNLEFSTDNVSFSINPVIDIQKYYRYTFDVSHISMIGTYLDFSASANYNVFTEEKEVSSIAPGNAGAEVTIKLGFGPAIATNNYQQTVPVNFQNYFYFIKAEDVDTSGSYLRIIDDPLTGPKRITYVTSDRFVYELEEVPQYDGTGSMSYTTTSRSAVGDITGFNIVNTGKGYSLLPTVVGVLPSAGNEASVSPVFDQIAGTINGVIIENRGSNYSKPVVVITDGDGEGAEFECVTAFGELREVKVLKKGSGYTYEPTIKIAESDVKVYLGSSNIGLPKTVTIGNPGKGFHGDNSNLGKYSSNTTFILREIDGPFYDGEIIAQPSTGATARVATNGYREGTNLLKVTGITGVFRNGEAINSANVVVGRGDRGGVLVAQYTTEFDPDIRYYIDNFGKFSSDRGKLSEVTQKLTDSFFYQDYSYIIRSKTSIDVWRDLIKQTIHPAGFKMFGEMVIDAIATPAIPEQKIVAAHFTVIEPGVQSIRCLQPDEHEGAPKQRSIISVQRYETLVVERGRGSVSIDTFDTSETRTFKVGLTPPFDGKFDPDTGQLTGTTTFSMVDLDSGDPVTLRKEEELFVTLDGIWQQPGVAYTVSGTQIEFAAPPFGERVAEGQDLDAVKFYGRAISFKQGGLADRYFRRLKDISPEFDGRKFEFDLYWEDGTIVKSDPYENFIVTLNGVVQKARLNSEEPFGNAYSIVRSEDANVTDRIRFTVSPIDNDDLYEGDRIPEILRNYEFCTILSVGSYERLTIDSNIYEYRGQGPYLLLDEITRDVRKIDDPSYALVFIDGVLQREDDAYRIVGPNIEFTEPLTFFIDETGRRVTQDVNVILIYGRDVPRTLTFYDYERSQFLNTINVTLSGTGISQQFSDVYEQIRLLSGATYYLYQDDKVVGNLVTADTVNPDETKLIVSNERNVVLYPDKPIGFKITFAYDKLNSYEYQVGYEGDYTVSYEYKTVDGERVVEKKVPPWLYGFKDQGDIWESRNSLLANLITGDRILIDGERSYRTVNGTTMSANVRSFNDGDLVQNNLYSKIPVTDYNGVTDGVGLSMVASVDQFGQVSSLNVAALKWNQRDLEIYLEGGPLLQPTAYGYYETPVIHFIPVDGNGGGARADVIAYGGQILDVVLRDGGSGYTQAPKVVVARRYKRIKENSRKIDNFTYLRVQPKLNVRIEQPNIVTEIIITGAGATSQFFTVVSFGSFTGAADPNTLEKRRITDHIWPDPDQVEQPFDLQKVPHKDERTVIGRPDINIEVFNTQIKKQVTLFNGGLVSHVTEVNFAKQPEKVNREITSHIFSDFREVINKYDTNVTSGLGTFLNAPVDTDDDILLVGNTANFPDTGERLRINGELIRYRKKMDDRFMNLERGYQGTTPANHAPGDLVFLETEYITAISAGATIIESEVTFTTKSQSEFVETVQIETEQIQPQFPYGYDHYELFVQTQNTSEESIGTTLQPDTDITVIAVPAQSIVTQSHFTNTEVRTFSATQYKVFPVYSNENARVRPEVERVVTEEVRLDAAPKVNQIISEIPVAIPSASLSTNILTLSHQETKIFAQQQIIKSASMTQSQVVENIKSTLDPRHSTSDVVIAKVVLTDARPEKHFTSITEQAPFAMIAVSDYEQNGGISQAQPSAFVLTTKEDLKITQIDQIAVNAGQSSYMITQATLDIPDHEMLYSTSKIIGRPVYHKQPLVLRVEGPVDTRHEVEHVSTITTASLDINVTSSSKLSPNMNRASRTQTSIVRRVY